MRIRRPARSRPIAPSASDARSLPYAARSATSRAIGWPSSATTSSSRRAGSGSHPTRSASSGPSSSTLAPAASVRVSNVSSERRAPERCRVSSVRQERIAARLRDQRLDRPLGEHPAGAVVGLEQRAGERLGLVIVERADLDAANLDAARERAERREERAQRGARLRVLRAVRRHEEQRLPRRDRRPPVPVEQPGEERGAVEVAPLEIVHRQHRHPGSGARQKLAERRHGSLPDEGIVGVLGGRRRRADARDLSHLREEARERREARRQRDRDLRAVPLPEPPAEIVDEPVDPLVRDRLLLEAPPREHQPLGRAGADLREEPLHQRARAHARTAVEQHDHDRAPLRRREGVAQLGELRRSADEERLPAAGALLAHRRPGPCLRPSPVGREPSSHLAPRRPPLGRAREQVDAEPVEILRHARDEGARRGAAATPARRVRPRRTEANGRRPVSASYSITPTAYQSAAVPARSPVASSGAMYAGVPQTTPAVCRSATSLTRARSRR